MAFVAAVAQSITMQGRSGRMYVLPYTKATAVGYASFTQDGQTFWTAPEDVRVVDAYVGDAVNAADYVDFYLNSAQVIQMRLMVKQINAATTVPHCPPSGWVRAGSQVSLYYYSA